MSTLTTLAEILREQRKYLDTNPGFESKSEPRDVVRRSLLWSGAIVPITIPAYAELKEVTLENSCIVYLRFSLKMPDGRFVNCNVRSQSDRREVQIAELMRYMSKNARANAEVEVLEKEMEDGEVHPYLDLYLTQKPATYELRIRESAPNFPGIRTFGCLCFFPWRKKRSKTKNHSPFGTSMRVRS